MVRKILLVGLIGFAGTVANADIASFGFTDLSGSYDTGSMIFSAVSITGGNGDTAGDVTRLAEGGGSTANFDVGFAGGGSMAAVDIQIAVSNIAGGMADGVGTFMITDADGDIFMGDVSGTWFSGAFGFTFMNAEATNVVFTRGSTGNGTFDGPSGGSFNSDSLSDVYFGAVSLLLRNPTAGFFDSNFGEISTQADGLIIPTPATIALAGLGLGFAGRRRR